jgi:hypothetical protein
METTEPQAQAHDDPAGTFRLSTDEVEELDAADREAEEEERAGKVVRWEDFAAELRRA